MIFIPVPKNIFDALAGNREDTLIITNLLSLSHGYAQPLRKIFVDEPVDENGYQCMITTLYRSECLAAEIMEIVISCERDRTEIKLKNIRKSYDRTDVQYYRQKYCSNCEGRGSNGDWCRGIDKCERIRKLQGKYAIDGETRAKAGDCENISYWGYKVGDIIRRKGEAEVSMITAIRGGAHDGHVFAFGEWIKDLTQYELMQSKA